MVTMIGPFDENLNGFILEPFNHLLDGTRHYHEHEAVVGDVVHVQSAADRKIRRTVVIEDLEITGQTCGINTSRKGMGLAMLSLFFNLGKVKYRGGTPSIHNALFGTKMFINRDLPDIQAFRQRFKEMPEYDENQFKISVFTPQKSVAIIVEFFHGAVKKMVSSIRECKQAHTTCKECFKKVNVVESKSSSSLGKNKVVFYSEDHGSVQVASRYKVIMHIIDQSGSAPIVFFNTMINKLSGYTVWELIKRHGMDVVEYWPRELLDLVGVMQSMMILNSSSILRMALWRMSLNRVLEMLPPSIEMGASGSGSVFGSKVNNFTDDSLNRVLEMHTPSTKIGVSGSTSGSGSKRVFINLDDIDSEDGVEGCNSSNIQKIVCVKVEKEDP
nr:replication protein A 70 kDa DNA-binding subunit B [Tanacetum cinerariifolium]